MVKLTTIWNHFFYSFPMQLLFNNFKRNHVLLLCWILLITMITGNFGKYLGIPYLFLDPEYLNEVNFMSFFIIGAVLSGFTVAFQITCYITDGHRFSFVGALRKPFTKFALNNSILPIAFLVMYVQQIISFQINNQYCTPQDLMMNLLGLLCGFGVFTTIYFIYFWFTNKDIFKYMVCRLDEKLKQNVRVTRASAMKKLDIARKKQVRVDNYFDYTFRFKKVDDHKDFYDRQTIVQVFDQNHFNLVVIQALILAVVLVLGIFKDNPAFQLPAAASFIILLTILVMLAGAFSYWFGSWSGTASLIVFLVFNYLAGQDFFSKPEKAFGLNYAVTPAEYSVENLQRLASPDSIIKDKAVTLNILNNWRNKFPEDQKPKMVFVTVSGGGKRAALWAMTALQTVDSITHGAAMENTTLITGASGGLIGASFYRELKLRQKLGEPVDPNSVDHRVSVSTDNLNPLIFSFLANGIFLGLTKFEYAGQNYVKDRAFTFEKELDEITDHMMDKTISAYRKPEAESIIPMMILTPIITNDGRKLYISPQPVSYLDSEVLSVPGYEDNKIGGVDFGKLFKSHMSDSLRFLSALRMSATFPYITPNTTLPTNPSIEIMDAGVSDNFGLSTTARFMYAFRDWINENTSGVILLSIRDSPKLGEIPPQQGQTIIDNITQPISNVYNNLENFQDINNDALIGQATSWLTQPLERIELQYQSGDSYVPILQKMDSIRQNNARASLSWRLTMREKQSVMSNIHSTRNRAELERLRVLLEKPVDNKQ